MYILILKYIKKTVKKILAILSDLWYNTYMLIYIIRKEEKYCEEG